jgi:hypothetical protein
MLASATNSPNAFEHFRDLFFGLFLLALFSTYLLSVVAGIIGAKKELEVGENPLTPVFFVLYGICFLLFFIWFASWLISLVAAPRL